MSGTGKVLSNENRQKKILEPEVKIEILKNDNHFSTIYGSPGDDSRPLPGDSTAYIENNNIGGKSAVGFLDTKNPPVSGDGERRLYSRDLAGLIKTLIFLKDNGIIEINADEIVINNGTDFAVRFTALETAFNELQAKFNDHVHGGVATGTISTDKTITPSIGDISLSKIDDIRFP